MDAPAWSFTIATVHCFSQLAASAAAAVGNLVASAAAVTARTGSVVNDGAAIVGNGDIAVAGKPTHQQRQPPPPLEQQQQQGQQRQPQQQHGKEDVVIVKHQVALPAAATGRGTALAATAMAAAGVPAVLRNHQWPPQTVSVALHAAVQRKLQAVAAAAGFFFPVFETMVATAAKKEHEQQLLLQHTTVCKQTRAAAAHSCPTCCLGGISAIHLLPSTSTPPQCA